MRLEPTDSIEKKARYKVVRLDNFAEIPGELVIEADDTLHKCKYKVKTYDIPNKKIIEEEIELDSTEIYITRAGR